MPIWEYKTITKPYDDRLTDEQLNQLGQHGLELTGVFVVSEKLTVVGRQETHNLVNYFFKRLKPAAKPSEAHATATPKPQGG